MTAQLVSLNAHAEGQRIMRGMLDDARADVDGGNVIGLAVVLIRRGEDGVQEARQLDWSDDAQLTLVGGLHGAAHNIISRAPDA